jgi:carotenoid 1,2-hydratase
MRDDRPRQTQAQRPRPEGRTDDAHDAGRFPRPVSGDGRSALWPRDTRMGGFISTTGVTHETSGPLPGGRRRSSGPGRSDGGDLGPAGGARHSGGPRFDIAVPTGGYAWWYVDALSDDKQHGLTVIAFIGSVFSPYYAWSGWRDPEHHCALNVALYRAGRDRWAMTERGRSDLSRDAAALQIGPSHVQWRDDALRIEVNEWTAPIPGRMRGTINLHAEAINATSFEIDDGGRHRWRPIAPRARIEVCFDNGALAWKGDAYLDSNWGAEPLERAFCCWDWSRAHSERGTTVHYDVVQRSGATRGLSLRFDREGRPSPVESPPRTQLPDTFWKLARTTRGAADAPPRLLRTLEDSPFYARSSLTGAVDGAPADIMHESLSLDRFRSPIVRAMLPFRMPRIVGSR